MTINEVLLAKLYSKFKQTQLAKTLQDTPVLVKPVVTLRDISNKKITRYFIRDVQNCAQVLEIDDKQYTNLKKNPRFVVTKIDWKIVGPPYSSITPYGAVDLGVEDYNKKEVQRIDRTFGCLKDYIRDYLELWYSDNQGNRTFVRKSEILNPPFPKL